MGLGSCLTINNPSFSFFSPYSHFAVHDVGKVKGRQQVRHVQEGLSVLLHHPQELGSEGLERVSTQLLKALLLVLRELLQDAALAGRLEVPCGAK